jgi:hypothetical protein
MGLFAGMSACLQYAECAVDVGGLGQSGELRAGAAALVLGDVPVEDEDSQPTSVPATPGELLVGNRTYCASA